MNIAMQVRAEVPETQLGAYGPRWYALRPVDLQTWRTLQWWRPVGQWAGAWLALAGLIWAGQRWVWLWPLWALLIAGRAGVFLQLTHEAAHRLIAKGAFNDWFGQWCAAAPIGLDLAGYKEGHLKHHQCASTTSDPPADAEKYRVCDLRDRRLWRLFACDLLGLTALKVRTAYWAQDATQPVGVQLRRYAGIVGWQVVIWQGLCQGSLAVYAGLWLLPLLTVHMVLMRIRGIAEHGVPVQRGLWPVASGAIGDRYTRSLGTPSCRYRWPLWNGLERVTIGSLHVNYHHEHHLWPGVPYYHLPALHQRVTEAMAEYAPGMQAPGYLACLWPAKA